MVPWRIGKELSHIQETGILQAIEPLLRLLFTIPATCKEQQKEGREARAEHILLQTEGWIWLVSFLSAQYRSCSAPTGYSNTCMAMMACTLLFPCREMSIDIASIDDPFYCIQKAKKNKDFTNRHWSFSHSNQREWSFSTMYRKKKSGERLPLFSNIHISALAEVTWASDWTASTICS